MNKRLHRAVPVLILGLLVQAPDVIAQTAATSGPEQKQEEATKQTTGHQQHRRGPKRITVADRSACASRTIFRIS